MRITFTLALLFFWCFAVQAQNIADYPYLVIPSKESNVFDSPQQAENLQKQLLAKNYNVFFENDAFPEDFRYNPCKGLKLHISKQSDTKKYSWLDCNNTTVSEISETSNQSIKQLERLIASIPYSQFNSEGYVSSQETSVTIVTQEKVQNKLASVHRATTSYDLSNLEQSPKYSDGLSEFYLVSAGRDVLLFVNAQKNIYAVLTPSGLNGAYHARIQAHEDRSSAIAYKKDNNWIIEAIAQDGRPVQLKNFQILP